MVTGFKSTRWLMVLALGNAALLFGLAVGGAWWLQWNPRPVVGAAGNVPLPPPPTALGSMQMEAPLPLPSRRRVIPRPPGEELVIDLDNEGNIRLGGEPIELGALRMKLCQLHADYRKRVLVTIRASDDCLFKHIRDVMNVCDECVISTYRLSSPPAPSEHGRPGLNDTSAV